MNQKSIQSFSENFESICRLLRKTCLQLDKLICPSKFLASSKFDNIKSLLRNVSRNQDDNYRPTNVLPSNAEIFKKLVCCQFSNHSNNILSKFQCDFRTTASALALAPNLYLTAPVPYLYLMVPVLNLYLPAPTLNLSLPVLRFTVKSSYVTVSTYTKSVSTYIYLLLKYNERN